jgi:hypothetical protein
MVMMVMMTTTTAATRLSRNDWFSVFVLQMLRPDTSPELDAIHFPDCTLELSNLLHFVASISPHSCLCSLELDG